MINTIFLRSINFLCGANVGLLTEIKKEMNYADKWQALWHTLLVSEKMHDWL